LHTPFTYSAGGGLMEKLLVFCVAVHFASSPGLFGTGSESFGKQLM
jgi:hypothetical protein